MQQVFTAKEAFYKHSGVRVRTPKVLFEAPGRSGNAGKSTA